MFFNHNIQNAEDINLKEQLRGEIRKEINKLEITCFDMASLLRGLGIPVNGGFKPMSQDVCYISLIAPGFIYIADASANFLAD